MNGIDWLAALGRLGPDDLRRVSRLVDLLAVVDRASSDGARSMLGAQPEPWTHDEARARLHAVIRYLELAADAGVDAGTASISSPLTNTTRRQLS